MTIKNYIQRYILLKINSGQWIKGQKLPSENQLSIKFNCSRITARQALLPLVTSGVLKVVKGKGYMVSDDTGDFNLQSFVEKHNVIKTVANEITHKIPIIFEILEMNKDDRYIVFEKKYFDEKGLLAYQITYLNNEYIWEKNIDGFAESITKELANQGAPITDSLIEIRFQKIEDISNISKELGYDEEYPIKIIKSFSDQNWIERTVRIIRVDKFRVFYSKTKFS